MKIKKIEINNFRGIRKLNWDINKDIICLIGPGDSSKTTILDAVEATLTPQYNYQFDDGDFYECNTENNIEIKLTVGNLSDKMLSEFKYGLYLRGWNYEKGIIDEPTEVEYEKVLTIRLLVDKSLEPEWSIYTERSMETKLLTNKQREDFGMRRINEYLDKHLTWGKGSALNKITDELKNENINDLMVNALRNARNDIQLNAHQKINETIEIVNQSAKEFGVPQKDNYKANIDTKALMLGYSSIVLSEANVPLRLLGKGSKKLLTVGLQVNSFISGSIILIDEIETALEPHRICRLLRTLKENVKNGQIIMTSHSDTVVAELGGDSISIANNTAGDVLCQNLSDEVNGTLRKVPYSLFSKKILISEGNTEEGFMRILEEFYIDNGYPNFTYQGVSVVSGGGNTFFKIAEDLNSLKYDIACLIDTDICYNNKKSKDDIEELIRKGIKIYDWGEYKCIEERIILDLPLEALQDLINYLFDLFDTKLINAIIGESYDPTWSKEISTWIDKGLNETEIREKISNRIVKNKYLKNNLGGEILADIVIQYYDYINTKETGRVIAELKKWIYNEI